MKSIIRKYEKPRSLSRNAGMNEWQESAGLWWLGWTLDLELVGRDGWGRGLWSRKEGERRTPCSALLMGVSTFEMG
jgi:hypothetical protein